jgi:hypothetical protein
VEDGGGEGRVGAALVDGEALAEVLELPTPPEAITGISTRWTTSRVIHRS